MADVLIRDVRDDVLAAVDARAGRLGLSRTAYLRRRLAQGTRSGGDPVEVTDLVRLGELIADATDLEVMAAAWR